MKAVSAWLLGRHVATTCVVMMLLLLAVAPAGATVVWEDYRGDQNAGNAYTGPAGWPMFGNYGPGNPVTNLRTIASNPANAIRTGSSTNINFLSNTQQCNTTVSPGSPACALQVMGRVSYALIRFPAAGTYTLSVAHDDDVDVDLSSDYANTNYRTASYNVPVGAVGSYTADENTYAALGTFTAAAANSCALVRMYWTNAGGLNFARLRWVRPGPITEVIPAAQMFDPGLAASSVGCNGSITGNSTAVSLNKVLGSQRAQAADQFTVQIGTTAAAGTVLQATTSGGGTGQQASTGAYPAVSGTTYYLRDLMAAGSASTLATAYTSTIACTRNGIAFTPAGAAPTWSVTPAANDQIVCNITNTARPILRLQKSLPSGRAVAGNQYQLSIAGGAGADVTVTTTGATNAPAEVAILNPAVAGTSYTLSEAAAGSPATVPTNYTTTYSCTNALAGGQTPSGNGTSFTVTPVAGDDLTCTFTNTALPPVNFCAANTIYNHDQIGTGASFAMRTHVFNTTSNTEATLADLQLALPGAAEVNALMVDPVNNRLIATVRTGANSSQLWAYDRANGGWYAASAAFTGSWPRAGMNQSGVGYLMGSTATPPVSRVQSSGTYTYSVTPIGNLSYNIPPSDLGSGDLAFDGDGVGWLAVGRDLWTIDFSASPLVAARLLRPTLGGAPLTFNLAGIAFATNGRLYVANSGNPSPASAYYQVDLNAGTISLAGSATNARDLASCAFPALAPAELTARKVLATVNGAAYVAGASVKAGDVLGYQITVTHAGGNLAATLYAGEVVDTLPANTTPVTAGNSFTCSGSTCTNSADATIAVGGSVVLNFIVQVNASLPVTATSIDNSVAVNGEPGVDCTLPVNQCTTTTPVSLAADLSVTKSNIPGTVRAGDSTSYTVVVTNNGPAATDLAVVRDDWTVSPGLDCSTVAGPPAEATCVASGTVGTQCPASVTPEGLQAGLTIPSLPSGGVLTFTLNCRVTATGQ